MHYGVNKKYELMLMTRARAYSSSSSEVILVHFVANHSSAAKNRQKSLKTLF